MIYKRCGRCGKRIPSGTTCACLKRNSREYAKPVGIKKEYHTQRWKDLREYILVKYNGIDIYTLYKYGRIELADTVHHIEATRDRPDLFYSESNLIPVSRKGHEEIHARYKDECRRMVQQELQKYKETFGKTGGLC